ncbi:CheY-P-specific phosphatase CheC [Geomonas limicola]|uniref:CheY-P-specific phosphatase CheC n=1 Tax=Geomonas limicola TaxID=2740186 RepID=A0A6V8NAD8_9BACT|nr:hypothetical protein [Geomonas limicola]GFO69410.1 CheY-P-specific phosphatase CheC [Geomonas limicola]
MSPRETFQEKQAQLRSHVRAVAAGLRQAGSALEQLLGTPVHCEPPQLYPTGAVLAAAPESAEPGTATLLRLQIIGKLSGDFLVLLNRRGTCRILELLLGEPPLAADSPSELGISALQEVGNILASACLNGLGEVLHTPLLPSIPRLQQGDAATLLASVLGEAPAGTTPALYEARFAVAGEPSFGSIYLVPDTASWQLIATAGPAN